MDKRLSEVQEIFRAIFDEPELLITRESNASTVEGWDSLAHINLLNSIERNYKIRFALGETEALKNVGDLLDLIEDKLQAK